MNEEMKTSAQHFKEKFPVFCIATLIYAILYALCTYDNFSGLAYGLFVMSSVVYILFCFMTLEIPLKKGSIFYIASIVLLAIATFCTDDVKIVFMNKTGIFFLTMLFLLNNVFDTRKWQFCKYVASLVITCIMSIAEICAPFENAYWYCKNKWDKKNGRFLYGFLGVVIAIPIVVVIFALLSSADVVFRDYAINIFGDINIVDMIIMTFMAGAMFMASYCVMSYLSKKEIDENVRDTKKIEPLLVIPATSLLTILYIAFSVIQIAYLFIGELKLPDGYSYSEYAREGFFQLLAVAILNLVIVLVCAAFAKPNKLLKIVLTVMSLCTFVMIISSAARTLTYIQFYYLTFLRIFVLWCLLVLAIIFVGVIVYIYKDKFPLFKYAVVVVTCLYIGLAFSHPDYIVAKVNLSATDENANEFFLGGGFDDYRFLRYLSADAAPAVADWMEDMGYSYTEGEGYINDKYYFFYEAKRFGDNFWDGMKKKTEDMGIKDFNFSIYMAKSLIKEQ